MVPERGLLIGQREKLGLSQEEVAARAGITLQQYQRFESHDANLSSSSFRIVHAVLTALELDTSAFNKGEYALEPLPGDDPLHEIMKKLDARGGCVEK
jgi:transcriptional regulator with XRE-family HTH domain